LREPWKGQKKKSMGKGRLEESEEKLGRHRDNGLEAAPGKTLRITGTGGG